MAFDVVVSRRAASKINAAISYIEDLCSNRPYAEQLYRAIERSIIELEQSAGFRIRDQAASELLKQDVYRIKLGKYKLLYVVDDGKKTIVVFSFFHQAQNLETLIRSDFANMN